MTGCGVSRIAIEKRVRGVLPADGAPSLDAHLAGCEPCRAREASARADLEAMRLRAARALPRMEAALSGSVPRSRPGRTGRWSRAGRIATTSLATTAWVAALAWFSSEPAMRSDRLVRALPTMAVLAVLVAYVSAWERRRLIAAVDQGKAIATWRGQVWASLIWSRRMQWATAAIAAFLLYKATTARSASYDPTIWYGGLALPAAAAWFWLRRVRSPRVEREALDLAMPLKPLPASGEVDRG